jgi:hypothetical protein
MLARQQTEPSLARSGEMFCGLEERQYALSCARPSHARITARSTMMFTRSAIRNSPIASPTIRPRRDDARDNGREYRSAAARRAAEQNAPNSTSPERRPPTTLHRDALVARPLARRLSTFAAPARRSAKRRFAKSLVPKPNPNWILAFDKTLFC